MVLLLTAFQASSSSAQVLETAISGSVTVDGEGVDGVGVDLFAQDDAGARGEYLSSTATADGGLYSFSVPGTGCFVLTFIAPEGQAFNGGQFLQSPVCVEDGETATVDVALDSNIPPEAVIGGTVSETTGDPVGGVSIDLFLTADDGSRGDYVGSTTTADDGSYDFGAPFGCYTLTFIAPVDRVFVSGVQFFQSAVCAEEGAPADPVDAVLQSDVPSDTSVGGTVTFRNGDVAEGVQVDLFTETEEGDRGDFVGFTRTADDGSYFFDVTEGCYVATFIAPDGESFVGGGQFLQSATCVESGNAVTDLNAVLDAEVVFPASLGGTVLAGDGAPIAGVEVTFWDTLGDGSRANYLGSENTDANGEFAFGVEAGCYWLVFVAPFGETFNDSQYLEIFRCVEDGEIVTDLDASLDSEVIPPTTTTTTVPSTTTTTTAPSTTTTTAPSSTTSTTAPSTTTSTTAPSTTTTTTAPSTTTSTTAPSTTTSTTAPSTTTSTTAPSTTTSTTAPSTTTTTTAPSTTTTTAPPAEITISVADVSVVELDIDGVRNAQVIFSLSAPAEQTVVVNYTTVDGTATAADEDYLPRAGELRFAPGRTELARAIRILGDADVEDDETLTVELSDPLNATIADGVGVITIIDNDVAADGQPF